MAAGDLFAYNDFAHQLAANEVILDSDTFKVALYTSTWSPAQTDADPIYTVTNEVSGTNYSAGGATVTSGFALNLNGAVSEIQPQGGAPQVSWTQHAAGPTNIRTGMLYSDTASPKHAIAYITFGVADISLVDGDITFTFSANAFTITRS